jgi:hypothetical protein
MVEMVTAKWPSGRSIDETGRKSQDGLTICWSAQRLPSGSEK